MWENIQRFFRWLFRIKPKAPEVKRGPILPFPVAAKRAEDEWVDVSLKMPSDDVFVLLSQRESIRKSWKRFSPIHTVKLKKIEKKLDAFNQADYVRGHNQWTAKKYGPYS